VPNFEKNRLDAVFDYEKDEMVSASSHLVKVYRTASGRCIVEILLTATRETRALLVLAFFEEGVPQKFRKERLSRDQGGHDPDLGGRQ
jgi:hypothetical protein